MSTSFVPSDTEVAPIPTPTESGTPPEDSYSQWVQYGLPLFFQPLQRWKTHLQCHKALPQDKCLNYHELLHQSIYLQCRSLPLSMLYVWLRKNYGYYFLELMADTVGLPDELTSLSAAHCMIKITELIFFFPLKHLITLLNADAKEDVNLYTLLNVPTPSSSSVPQEKDYMIGELSDDLGKTLLQATVLWRGLISSAFTFFRFEEIWMILLEKIVIYTPFLRDDEITQYIRIDIASGIIGFLKYPLETITHRSQIRAFCGNNEINLSLFKKSMIFKSALVSELHFTFSNINHFLSLYDGYPIQLLESAGIGCLTILLMCGFRNFFNNLNEKWNLRKLRKR